MVLMVQYLPAHREDGTQLLGAALGALVPSPRSAGYVSIPLLGLVGISASSTRSPPCPAGSKA
jgi:hypothetical protein